MANIYETYNVSFQQVQSCERIGSTTTRPAYYRVASAQNDGTEYTVEYNRTLKALICNCKAGQNGIGCWHKRACLAHSAELRDYRRAMQEKEQAIAEQEIAAEVAEDKLGSFQAAKREARATNRDGLNAYNRPPFQFLR